MFDRDKPYDELPYPPEAAFVESRAVLKRAVGAASALSELRGATTRIPNPSILINAIALQEARMSSEIENIVTTNDALYRASADIEGEQDAATKEVLRYREALWNGFVALKERPLLTTNLLIEIARTIKNRPDFDIRKIPGTRIAGPGDATMYTPPSGERIIRDKLAELERFIHDEQTIEPLVKTAMIHYQFEAIHPFHDGNGRTGRILILLFLLQQKLLDIPVLYVSRYIIANKSAYYSLLQGVTERQAWEPWILYMLDAIESTARSTLERINDIAKEMERFTATLRAERPRIHSRELVEAVFMQPYVRIPFLEHAGVAKRQTASRYLKELVACGLLREVRRGREAYFVNEGLVGILAR